MHSSSILLRVLAAITLLSAATGCEEEKTPAAPAASLNATIDNRQINVRDTGEITVRSRNLDRSPGTSDVTATVNTGDEARLSIVRKGDTESNTSTTASSPPDADGNSFFTVLCKATGSGSVAFKDSNGTATVAVTCVDEKRPVSINVADCSTKLQADGISTCKVEVTLGGAPAGATFDVRLGAVTEGGAVVDGSGLNVLSKDGSLPVRSLADIAVDGQGKGSFFVHSPAIGRELGLELVVVDGATIEKSVVTIKSSNGAPTGTYTVPTTVIEEDTVDVILSVRNPNGTAAAGGAVAFEVTGGEIVAGATEDCVLTEDAGTLDAAGVCKFKVKVDSLNGALVGQLRIKATFALPGLTTGVFEASAVINPIGTLDVVATATSSSILPLGATPLPGSLAREEVVVSVTMKKATPLTNSSAIVSVRESSRSLLRLFKHEEVVLSGAKTSAFPVIDAPGGKFKFTVVSPDPNALGTGLVDITVTDPDAAPGTPPTRTTVSFTIERQRRLSSLRFVAHDPRDVIGVAGSPTPNFTSAKFELTDEAGDPVVGELVTFRVESSSTAGVFVSPSSTSGVDGTVSGTVTSGRIAAPITIIATVVSRPDLETSSSSIAVISGLPNSAYSAFQCAAKATFDPFVTTCTASLNDHFTNVVTSPQNVQFRAESGNISPFAQSGATGTAAATFTFSEPGPGSADLRQWSYARATPLTAPNNAAFVAAFPGCFDRTNRTPCDLIAICKSTNPSISGHCPLPPSKRIGAASCVADISAAALTALDLGGNADPAIRSQFADDVFSFGNALANSQYDAYLDDFRACGLPLSCLRADRIDGIDFDAGDGCPVNVGCLDFTGVTECPQDGLLNVIASVRGEEGFDDVDRDGIRDDGVNAANGGFETFIDYPEPFLDKNSSCSYDDLNALSSQGTPRGRLAPGEVIRLSDQFIDSSDGVFGFNGNETNGVHDTNTDIFMGTTIVHLSGRGLQFGEAVAASQCGANGAALVTCTQASTGGAIGSKSLCTENALTNVGAPAILEGCLPLASKFRDGDTASFVYRWTDANGNCPTPDFSGTVAITADGPAEVIADDADYSPALCGALPGAINVSNVDRPWCEEHPFMGSLPRNISIRAKCGAETGNQLVKLTFTIDDFSTTRTVAIGCPVCGDSVREGEEECDGGATCDATCKLKAT